MDKRPTPPPASPEDYGAHEAVEAPEAAEGNGQVFDAVAEFTVPVEPQRPRLAPIPFHEIQLGTSAVYLVKDLIPREGLVVVWGPPKCGKSFWTFDLVMHLALGWEYRGRKVKQGAVVYVACEGQQGFKARIEAFRQRHLSDVAGDVLFYLVPASIDLIAEHEDLVAAIRAELGSTVPSVVTLDTLNRSIQGDENSSEDMTAYIRAAGAIQAAFGCVVRDPSGAVEGLLASEGGCRLTAIWASAAPVRDVCPRGRFPSTPQWCTTITTQPKAS